MKFKVTASREATFEVEAADAKEARELIDGVPFKKMSWSDDLVVHNVSPIEIINPDCPPGDLKIGDTVQVRSDLVEFKTYGAINTTPEMAGLGGETATITSIRVFNDTPLYYIDIDENGWRWSREMFE